jgi:phosphinothricin acetyltransferase
MHIRNATIDDLPVIVAIYNTAIPTYRVTADLTPVSVASRQPWFAEHSPDHRPLWVAQDGDQVVGWMSLSSVYGRPAYEKTCEVSIYLAPDRCGRGLGTQLLQHCLEQAPRVGVTTLLGLIFGRNAPSLRLFAKMGFQQWGCLPRVAELAGVEHDLVILGRRV